MKCLETGKVCTVKKKCKVCVLDDCRKTLEVLENMMLDEDVKNVEIIKRQLPEKCSNCSMLQILNKTEHKVYCPYMLKNECLISNYVRKGNK